MNFNTYIYIYINNFDSNTYSNIYKYVFKMSINSYKNNLNISNSNFKFKTFKIKN